MEAEMGEIVGQIREELWGNWDWLAEESGPEMKKAYGVETDWLGKENWIGMRG